MIWRVILLWLFLTSLLRADLPKSVPFNFVAQRQAHGLLNGVATSISASLDGNQMPVTTVGSNDNYEWRAQLQLAPGAHQLVINAVNWSGYYTASATNTFTNNAADHAVDTYAGNGAITNRVWVNSAGQTNATESLSFDGRNRLHNVTYIDNNTNGYIWTAVYDGLGRRLSTTTTFVTNGVVHSNFAQTISQNFDPQVQFLEVAETDGGSTTYKYYGPDANGTYGGMQGVGGLEAVVNGPRTAGPLINDMRGDAIGMYGVMQGTTMWFPSRVTAYGAVPGYSPLPLGDGTKVAQASAWRGKWQDITGLYWLGNRYYDPIAGRWLSFDPSWNETDPNGLTFCGGQPVTLFDPNGLLGQQMVQQSESINVNGISSFLQAAALGATGSILQGIASTPTVFNQGAQEMAYANDEISTYTGSQAFLAQTLALPANFAFGVTSLVNNPVNTVSGIPGAIAQLPGNIANNIQGFASGPSINGGFALLQNGLQVGGLVEGGASVLEGTSGLLSSTGETAITANPLTTSQNQAVFWSGIPNGASTAAQWAGQNGGVTLEQTVATSGVQLPAWDASNPSSVSAWTQASRQFAAGASGDVTVLQGSAVRVNSIWARTEFPALQANPNVNSITAINPATGEQVSLWSR